MSRASIDINCTRARAHKTGSIEQEIPAGKELSVMRNRADGTRKINTCAARCNVRNANRTCASGAGVDGL